MQLVRAAIAATGGAAKPEHDRRFWAVIREVLRAREADGRIDTLL